MTNMQSTNKMPKEPSGPPVCLFDADAGLNATCSHPAICTVQIPGEEPTPVCAFHSASAIEDGAGIVGGAA